MPTYSDDEELGTPNQPFLLVRRHVPSSRTAAELDADEELGSQSLDLSAIHDDRMTPAVSGGIAGFLGGTVALAVVHGLRPEALARSIVVVADARGVDPAVALGIAYATAAALGSLVGATFAVVTRYLRKWGPLALWALVFFVSLAMLLLAISSAYGRGAGATLTGPILAASAAFGFVVSFSLPIRRRR
ncbi:MAG TPA: hypothetical protein VM925_06315 [Labilithrix sp.]|nr:hypothetical protein [Labilithrix sp.]